MDGRVGTLASRLITENDRFTIFLARATITKKPAIIRGFEDSAENRGMTEHQEHQDESNEDSTTDVISAVALITIAVVFMVYWLSNQ